MQRMTLEDQVSASEVRLRDLHSRGLARDTGAIGTMVYALQCPEMAAPFLGIWYLAGMLIPAAIGAVLGPWLLRW